MASWTGIESWQSYTTGSITTVCALYVLNRVWKKLKPIAERFSEYVINGAIFHIVPLVNQATAARLTLRAYVRYQLNGSSKTVRIPAVPPVMLDVDQIFVPLVLERVGEDFDHSTILFAGNRIQIIGDPGSGKSSVAKRIFRDACREALVWPRQARFPMMVELRTIKFPEKLTEKDSEEWFLRHLREELSKLRTYETTACFEAYLQTRGALLILDGLDEIPNSSYNVAMRAINGLSTNLNRSSERTVIILTMRSQMHRLVHADFADSYPLVANLKRFSPTDIYEFLTRWKFTTNKTAQVVRIYKNLTDHPNLREMCTNPLVLSMYVARDQQTGGAVNSETRTEFYSRVTDELIVYRRASQTGAPEGLAIIREQRQRILGQIAYDHLLDPEQPANLLSWDHAVQVVMKITGADAIDAQKGLRQISIDTGLISEERPQESFRFIHLTFCEFLAAFEAINGQPKGWNMLLNRHKSLTSQESSALHPRLSEVLPFACALMPRLQRADAISDLAEFGNDRLLSISFLETKAYDHKLWLNFANSMHVKLLSSVDAHRDTGWLSYAHLFMVICNDADRAAALGHGIGTGSAIRSFFESLAQRDDDTILSLIVAYAKQDAAAAFRVAELIQIDLLDNLPTVIVQNCDQPPFFALVLERAIQDQARFMQWTCAIAESALSSKAAGALLWNASERPWLSLADLAPSRVRWFKAGLLKRNSLTECLTVACQTQFGHESFPLLSQVQKIRPPGSRVLITPFSLFSDPRQEFPYIDTFNEYGVFIAPVSALIEINTILMGAAGVFVSLFFSGRGVGIPHWLFMVTAGIVTASLLSAAVSGLSKKCASVYRFIAFGWARRFLETEPGLPPKVMLYGIPKFGPLRILWRFTRHVGWPLNRSEISAVSLMEDLRRSSPLRESGFRHTDHFRN